MKVLIVNLILYTSETENIARVESVKDTMIYDLCLAFHKKGIDVTLAAAQDYKPSVDEDYPFEIKWFKSVYKNIFKPNLLPFCPGIAEYASQENFDLIISSEVFSLSTLALVRKFPNKVIAWHEIAKHNRFLKQIPSKVWYNLIAKKYFKNTLVVARSNEARSFISNYCKNVSQTVVDHGVNLEKFEARSDKENYFIVSSQLIKRKRINLIIEKFNNYLKKYDSTAKLYIMGEGEERSSLEAQVNKLGIEENVLFFGKMPHAQLKEYLACAMAMLVYTEKDNNMISIVESLACTTPVITTCVPYNASYISKYNLGIADSNWSEEDLHRIASNEKYYVDNCVEYRHNLSDESKVDTFLHLAQEL